MSLLDRLVLDDIAPARVWAALDTETRRQAAESLYRGARSSDAGRGHADLAIASRLRFRDVAVRRLPIERRVQYLVSQVRPDDSLASSLLLALHLEHRRPLLERFLTRLDIPNEEGLIRDDHDLHAPATDRLAEAAASVYQEHAQADVDLYLASLLAMDGEVWGGIAEVLRGRAGA
jgi:hypothetical protein